jgi:predicted phosphodiesterase
MRYGIFGDIHGNYDALLATLEALEQESCDLLICLGDVVGYGAEPCECIEKVRGLGCVTLAGNHDHAAIDRLDVEFFNAFARQAALWTREQLSEDDKKFLEGLGFIDHYEHFAAVHGSLHGPELFNYIATIFDAELSFEALDKPVLFYGHTHIPLTFFDTTPMTYTMENEIRIMPDMKALVNVGSVGQPRDEDPRASFAVYEMTDSTGEGVVRIRRIPYDVQSAGRKIREAGLPEPLAIRLELGK